MKSPEVHKVWVLLVLCNYVTLVRHSCGLACMKNHVLHKENFTSVQRCVDFLLIFLFYSQALSVIYDLLEHVSSPFNNLKYVKLPQGCRESSISGTTKSYLLGGSPGATMVTSLPKVLKISLLLIIISCISYRLYGEKSLCFLCLSNTTLERLTSPKGGEGNTHPILKFCIFLFRY